MRPFLLVCGLPAVCAVSIRGRQQSPGPIVVERAERPTEN